MDNIYVNQLITKQITVSRKHSHNKIEIVINTIYITGFLSIFTLFLMTLFNEI